MNFKEWLITEQASILPDVRALLQNVERSVLRSMKTGPEGVSFSFPLNYDQFTPETISSRASIPAGAQLSLAAHTITIEAIGHGVKYGKGEMAYRALGGLTKPDWTPEEIMKFKRGLQKGIRKFAGDLGFLFELDVFIFLHEDAGLNDIRGYVQRAYGQRDHHVSEIRRLAHKGAINQIISFAGMHAENLGRQILQKTRSILRCNVDQIEFTGGGPKFIATREDPADIRLSCSSGKRGLGWNIKFGSETRMQLAGLSHSVAYKMLGGTMKSSFAEDLSDAGEDYKKIKMVTLGYLEDAARKTFGEHPGNLKKFVSILNNLISGSAHETMIAPRNYITGLGGAEFSKNIKKDFQTTTKPGPKLRARSDATVEINATDTYLMLTYKVPGGSFDGTKITFWPRAENVAVKVTNLTTERR